MIDTTRIVAKQNKLANHSLLVTNSIQTIEDLRIFMEHHVFAVWDFMSLIKTLQHHACPSTEFWMPTKGTRSNVARIINEIVLCEESDMLPDGQSSISHFDLYLQAMVEVGADTSKIIEFLNTKNFEVVPKPALEFIQTTFNTIKQGSHCTASSFCYGRETVIPSMFKRILRQLNISALEAPKFHYYLERHIQVDGEDHGPKAEMLLEHFCDNDPIKAFEAEKSAIDAINARIKLFDQIESLVL
jgi:hypothetical protein